VAGDARGRERGGMEREEREREREEIERRGRDGAIRAPRQKPPRGTNGRLSSHLRLVHIPSKSGGSRGREEAQKGEGVRGERQEMSGVEWEEVVRR